MEPPDVAAMRESYELAGLLEPDLAPTWLEQLERWLADAVAAQLPEPNAMVVATAGASGAPSARLVLLKGLDERGLTFFTNLQSRKGRDLAENPVASLLFPWHALQRQVRLDGRAELVSEEENDAYFASRPWGSRIGAIASPQSQVVPARDDLEQRWAAFAAQHPESGEVPRPPHWGGVRVVPDTVEFWQGRRDRMHDRLRFRRDADGWVLERLAP